jgi:putative DNA primase/helicase
MKVMTVGYMRELVEKRKRGDELPADWSELAQKYIKAKQKFIKKHNKDMDKAQLKEFQELRKMLMDAPDTKGTEQEIRELQREAQRDVSEPEMIDILSFFNDEKFISKRLGDAILRHNRMRTTTDNETVFVYADGIWHNSGEGDIKSACNQMLEDEFTAHRASEVIAYIKSGTYIDRKQFDPDPYKIAMGNGVYDVKNMEFLKHSHEHMITAKLPFNYERGADCPQFKKFVSEVVDESDIAVIQELFGYCLVRNYNFKKMAMLIGGGDNGKSVLLNTLKMFLGADNTVKLSLQELASDKFARAKLYSKMANVFNDLEENSVRSTGWIKTLTGGDSISARTLFKGYFDFTNYAKLIFSCNKFPMSKDNTDAYVDRWLFIDFPNKFEGDKVVPMQELLARFEAELPGIFNWSLEGITRVYKQNGFSNNASTEKKRELIIRMSDPLGAFIMDMVEEDLDATIQKKPFYQTYVDYCHRHKIGALSIDVFGKNLLKYVRVQAARQRINGVQTYVWKGVRLKNMEEADKKDKKLDEF